MYYYYWTGRTSVIGKRIAKWEKRLLAEETIGRKSRGNTNRCRRPHQVYRGIRWPHRRWKSEWTLDPVSYFNFTRLAFGPAWRRARARSEFRRRPDPATAERVRRRPGRGEDLPYHFAALNLVAVVQPNPVRVLYTLSYPAVNTLILYRPTDDENTALRGRPYHHNSRKSFSGSVNFHGFQIPSVR